LDPLNYRARADLANLLIAGARGADGTVRPEALKEAKTQLDILHDKQPNSPDTHQAWSNYYAVQGSIAPAMQEMQQAITLDPNRSASYLELGLLQLRSNLTDQAEASFKKAIAVDPKATNAILALGGLYQSHNRLPEAEQQMRHAIDVDPNDPGPRTALVRLLLLENKRSEIESFLQKTKKDLPNNSEGYRMLGDFYFATGDVDKATAEYASLYRDHSSDPLVKNNYIQLLILKNRL